MANTKLKLVVQNGKKIGQPRRTECDYSKRGYQGKLTHSVTPEQAVIAATRRIISGDFDAGAIYNEHGKLVIIVRRVRNMIMIEDKSRKHIK